MYGSRWKQLGFAWEVVEVGGSKEEKRPVGPAGNKNVTWFSTDGGKTSRESTSERKCRQDYD